MKRLNQTQVRILKALEEAGTSGLSREELTEKVGRNVGSSALGPVYQETVGRYPESLVGRKLVQAEQFGPSEPVVYSLTALGGRAAKRHRALPTEDCRGVNEVPKDRLLRAVLSIKAYRPYGFEKYTEDDLKEIRKQLGKAHDKVNVEALRERIVNLRKTGAFKARPVPWPAWYSKHRKSDKFGKVREKFSRLVGGCSVNPEHDGEVEGYHRRFTIDGKSIIGKERPEDLIALCPACYRRSWKYLAEVPEKAPD